MCDTMEEARKVAFGGAERKKVAEKGSSAMGYNVECHVIVDEIGCEWSIGIHAFILNHFQQCIHRSAHSLQAHGCKLTCK